MLRADFTRTDLDELMTRSRSGLRLDGSRTSLAIEDYAFYRRRITWLALGPKLFEEAGGPDRLFQRIGKRVCLKLPSRVGYELAVESDDRFAECVTFRSDRGRLNLSFFSGLTSLWYVTEELMTDWSRALVSTLQLNGVPLSASSLNTILSRFQGLRVLEVASTGLSVADLARHAHRLVSLRLDPQMIDAVGGARRVATTLGQIDLDVGVCFPAPREPLEDASSDWKYYTARVVDRPDRAHLNLSGLPNFASLEYVATRLMTEEGRAAVTTLHLDGCAFVAEHLERVSLWFPNVDNLGLRDVFASVRSLECFPRLGRLMLFDAEIEAVGGLGEVRRRAGVALSVGIYSIVRNEEWADYVMERVVKRRFRDYLDLSEVASVDHLQHLLDVMRLTRRVIRQLAISGAVVTGAQLESLVEFFPNLRVLHVPVVDVDRIRGWPVAIGRTGYPRPPREGSFSRCNREAAAWLEERVGCRLDRARLDLSGRALTIEDLRYVRACLHDPATVVVNLDGTGRTQDEWDNA